MPPTAVQGPDDRPVPDLPDDLDDDDYGPPLPPDGGWGWVVVLASLVCNIIVDGVCFTFAIFYVELLDYYHESQSKTAMVGSLIPGMYLSLGPIVGALCNKYGCRAVTMSGAIIASISFFLSTFSPNVNVLIFTYGIMGGLGFGLMYLPAIVIVGFYFDKKRAFATGIAVCGSGIGTFIFERLGRVLLACYGWKGSMWVIAGIILNGIACGAVYRPLTAQKPKRKRRARTITESEEKPRKSIIMQKILEEKKRQRTISTGSLDGSYITKDNKIIKDPKQIKNFILERLEEEEEELKNGSQPNIPTRSSDPVDIPISNGSLPSGSPLSNTQDNGVRKVSTVSLPASSGKLPTGSTVGSTGLYNKHLAAVHSTEGLGSSRIRTISNNSNETDVNYSSNTSISSTKRRKDMERPMYRQDIFYAGSVHSLPEFKSNPDMQMYVASTTSIPVPPMSFDDDQKCHEPFFNVINTMFDFSLFKCVVFDMLCATSTLAMLGFFTPFVYLTQHALRCNIEPNKATFLISILGISNTMGRVLCGWICDRSWSDCLLIHNMALVIGGIVTCLVPFMTEYWMFVIYCIIFGLCIAAFISLRSIVLVDLLGLEKLTNSFGLLLLFQGISSIIGSPVSGAIFDQTGSYMISFMVAGGVICIAGLISLPVRRVAAWENSRNTNFQDIERIGSAYTRVSDREMTATESSM